MAFTLEATLVVPLSLSIIVGLTGLTWPILQEIRSTSQIIAQAQAEQLTLARLYNVADSDLALQTSPQHMIEWIELTVEGLRLFGDGKDGSIHFGATRDGSIHFGAGDD